MKSNHSLGGRMSESAPSKEQTGANMLQRMAMRKQKIDLELCVRKCEIS